MTRAHTLVGSSGLFILIKAASLFFITGLLMKVIVKTVVMASR